MTDVTYFFAKRRLLRGRISYGQAQVGHVLREQHVSVVPLPNIYNG